MITLNDNVFHAETIADARKLIRFAKRCFTYTAINADEGLEIEVSKASLLRALSEKQPDSPCGGILWESTGDFRLDTCD